jgi:hypothetical protein
MKNTFIIYDGPSKLDGGPVVAILTLTSTNKKLVKNKSKLAQVWFLRKDVDPIKASRLGLDKSICGDCAFMGTPNFEKESGQADNRGCYVLLYMRPNSLFKAIPNLQKISIQEASQLVKGLVLRIGAYGDSGCIDSKLLDPLVKVSKKHLGYTHQWKNPKAGCSTAQTMASVESLKDAITAQKAGYRTFRVITDIKQKADNEILCPASDESPAITNCSKCGLCNGSTSKSFKNIAIVAHGAIKKHTIKHIEQVQ